MNSKISIFLMIILIIIIFFMYRNIKDIENKQFQLLKRDDHHASKNHYHDGYAKKDDYSKKDHYHYHSHDDDYADENHLHDNYAVDYHRHGRYDHL